MTLPSTRAAPCTLSRSSTTEAGIATDDGAPLVLPSAGRTTTSPTVEANSAVKLRSSVSEKISEPPTNATPSTIANVLISRRSLRPSRLLKVALSIGVPQTPSVAAVIRAMISSTCSRSGLRTSSTIRPSARNTTRSVYDAATGSWLTITTV